MAPYFSNHSYPKYNDSVDIDDRKEVAHEDNHCAMLGLLHANPFSVSEDAKSRWLTSAEILFWKLETMIFENANDLQI